MTDHHQEQGPEPGTGIGTIRNILLSSLRILGRTGIPGIGAATEALVQVLTKIREMPQNACGWKALEERLESLAFLAAKKDYDMDPKLSSCLTSVLQNIAQGIDASGKQGRLKKFFNSTDDSSFIGKYNLHLTDLITDIMVDVVFKTHQAVTQIREDLEIFKSNLETEVNGSANEQRLLQKYTNTIVLETGTVGLETTTMQMPNADQEFTGTITLTSGVVGIKM
ncbi:hypothetical protein C8F01DRAFT_1147154, partial [Mycena amicta]